MTKKESNVVSRHAGKVALLLLVLFTWSGALIGAFVPFWDSVGKMPTSFGFAYVTTWVLICIYLIIWLINMLESEEG